MSIGSIGDVTLSLCLNGLDSKTVASTEDIDFIIIEMPVTELDTGLKTKLIQWNHLEQIYTCGVAVCR